jgi:hypothetical protein
VNQVHRLARGIEYYSVPWSVILVLPLNQLQFDMNQLQLAIGQKLVATRVGAFSQKCIDPVVATSQMNQLQLDGPIATRREPIAT